MEMYLKQLVHQVSHTAERNDEVSSLPDHDCVRHITKQQLKKTMVFISKDESIC